MFSMKPFDNLSQMFNGIDSKFSKFSCYFQIGNFYLGKQEYSIHPKDYLNKLLGDRTSEKYEVVINKTPYIVSALKPSIYQPL